MSAARKAAWADPEVRARMSAASKAAWADPEVRARMSAARKAAWAELLLPEQIKVYKTLRRKGCSHEEALHEARRPHRLPAAAQ
jgi:hypothetical protein